MVNNDLTKSKIGQNPIIESVSRIEPFTLRSAPNDLASLMMKMAARAAVRLRSMVEPNDELPDQSVPLLQTALRQGEVERGHVNKIMMVSERTGRRIVQQLIDCGLLASERQKESYILNSRKIALLSYSPDYTTKRLTNRGALRRDFAAVIRMAQDEVRAI